MAPHFQDALREVRAAYLGMDEVEKAKIMRFTARHRFTDDLFETWLRESGLQTGELRREMIAERQLPPVREKLDAALLRESNEQLMCDTLRKYVLAEDSELLRDLIAWVDATKALGAEPLSLVRETLASETAPEPLSTHPQFALVVAALKSGLLDESVEALAREVRAVVEAEAAAEAEREAVVATDSNVAETGADPAQAPASGEAVTAALVPISRPIAPRPSPAEKSPAGEESAEDRLDRLQALMDRIEEDLDRIRLAGFHENPSVLTSRIHEAIALGHRISDEVSERGDWSTLEQLRELTRIEPHSHREWAEEMVEFLETLRAQHPLRRKREAAEAIRQGAADELRNFAALGGILETVPGPQDSAEAWWTWAIALEDNAFDRLEDWCSKNSLDQLADLVAEQWSSAAVFHATEPQPFFAESVEESLAAAPPEISAEAPSPSPDSEAKASMPAGEMEKIVEPETAGLEPDEEPPAVQPETPAPVSAPAPARAPAGGLVRPQQMVRAPGSPALPALHPGLTKALENGNGTAHTNGTGTGSETPDASSRIN